MRSVEGEESKQLQPRGSDHDVRGAPQQCSGVPTAFYRYVGRLFSGGMRFIVNLAKLVKTKRGLIKPMRPRELPY